MSGFNNNTENKILYSRDTLKRIVSDIKQLKKNPLNSQGIYYKHDEDDILKGYALVFGPQGTPYEYGSYLFTFNFPNDYPHRPPVVTFFNWGDNIRFNPNLYRNGKVCLSLLNTWKGEGWTSCQTLTTILLTLCTVLNDFPLTNEPGFTMAQEVAVLNYNKIILFKNIDLAICKCYMNFHDIVPVEFHDFYNNIKEHIVSNKENIKKSIERLTLDVGKDCIIQSHYSMNVGINFVKLKNDFNELYKKIDI